MKTIIGIICLCFVYCADSWAKSATTITPTVKEAQKELDDFKKLVDDKNNTLEELSKQLSQQIDRTNELAEKHTKSHEKVVKMAEEVNQANIGRSYDENLKSYRELTQKSEKIFKAHRDAYGEIAKIQEEIKFLQDRFKDRLPNNTSVAERYQQLVKNLEQAVSKNKEKALALGQTAPNNAAATKPGEVETKIAEVVAEYGKERQEKLLAAGILFLNLADLKNNYKHDEVLINSTLDTIDHHLKKTLLGRYVTNKIKDMKEKIQKDLCENAEQCLNGDNPFHQNVQEILSEQLTKKEEEEEEEEQQQQQRQVIINIK